jgi:hypothetical protein
MDDAGLMTIKIEIFAALTEERRASIIHSISAAINDVLPNIIPIIPLCRLNGTPTTRKGRRERRLADRAAGRRERGLS